MSGIFPLLNFFVILNYTVKNVTNKYIDSVYVGLWTDAVVRNTKITGLRAVRAFYNKGGDGYSDSLKIAYEFDATGDVGLYRQLCRNTASWFDTRTS